MKPLTPDQIQSFVAAIPSAKRDEAIAPKTYLKIGGVARLFVVASTSDELVSAVTTAIDLQIPWTVIGGASNVLVSDDGYEGVLIQASNRAIRIEGSSLIAEAGAFTGLVAREASKAGLTKFEWGIGVPGTIGGALYGDAGCFGGEMRDIVRLVKAFDAINKKIVEYSNADCHFGYRDSRFKHEPHVILEVTLDLTPGDATESQKKLEEISAKRKDTQPQGAFSAGCLFKNFEFQDDAVLSIADKHLQIPPEMRKNKRIAAGWLIDQAGLKGTTIGKAQVSPVHGNFLINLGGARAQDVIALSSLVKMKIRDEYGILLEDEVQLVGF